MPSNILDSFIEEIGNASNCYEDRNVLFQKLKKESSSSIMLNLNKINKDKRISDFRKTVASSAVNN